MESELSEVKLSQERAWILRTDAPLLDKASPSSTVRLLPAGDPYLGAADRSLIVPDPRFRAELWPRSVWPGALFASGELVGTWRRQQGRVRIQPWKKLASEIRDQVEGEVRTLPIESAKNAVVWEQPLASG